MQQIRNKKKRVITIPKYITSVKMERFFELMELQKGAHIERDILIFRMLYETAMRIGEFSKVRRQDIDFERNCINIPGHITKSKTGRIVPISATTSRKLNAYINKRKDNYLFQSEHKRPLSIRGYQNLFTIYFVDKDLANILSLPFIPSPHTIRHSSAVKYIQSGLSLPALQSLLSHHYLETTQIYTKISSADSLLEIESKVNLNWH